MPGASVAFKPETISAALFSVLQTSGFAFKKYERRGRLWTNVAPSDQPYLALIETGARAVQDSTIGLTNWTLHYLCLVYIRADANPSSVIVPATQLNNALQALANAIDGTGEKQSLGVGVNNCWIDGNVYMDTGIVDQQMALGIPISVEVGI